MPHRVTGVNTSVVRRQKPGATGKSRPKPYLGFPWERQGKVNSLGRASLSHSGGLWAR